MKKPTDTNCIIFMTIILSVVWWLLTYGYPPAKHVEIESCTVTYEVAE